MVFGWLNRIFFYFSDINQLNNRPVWLRIILKVIVIILIRVQGSGCIRANSDWTGLYRHAPAGWYPLKCLNKLSPLIWAYLWIQDFFILENCPDKLLPSLRAYLWIQVLNFDTAIWYQHQTFTGTLVLLGGSRVGKLVSYLRNQEQMRKNLGHYSFYTVHQ